MSIQSKIYKGGIQANLEWLDRLAWFALLFFGAAVVAKLFGLTSIGFLGVAINLHFAIVALAVVTLCHAFVAVHLVNSLGRGRRTVSPENRERFYLEQLASGGLLIRGTTDYRSGIEAPARQGTVQLRTDVRDPAVWSHLLLSALAVVASVPFELSWTAALVACFAIGLVFVNYSIGASWLIALADFGRTEGESLYFVEDSEQIRLTAYPISGPIPHRLGVQVPKRAYIVRLAINFAIHVLPLLFLVGIARLAAAFVP